MRVASDVWIEISRAVSVFWMINSSPCPNICGRLFLKNFDQFRNWCFGFPLCLRLPLSYIRNKNAVYKGT